MQDTYLLLVELFCYAVLGVQWFQEQNKKGACESQPLKTEWLINGRMLQKGRRRKTSSEQLISPERMYHI